MQQLGLAILLLAAGGVSCLEYLEPDGFEGLATLGDRPYILQIDFLAINSEPCSSQSWAQPGAGEVAVAYRKAMVATIDSLVDPSLRRFAWVLSCTCADPPPTYTKGPLKRIRLRLKTRAVAFSAVAELLGRMGSPVGAPQGLTAFVAAANNLLPDLAWAPKLFRYAYAPRTVVCMPQVPPGSPILPCKPGRAWRPGGQIEGDGSGSDSVEAPAWGGCPDKNAILKIHNDLRKKHGARPLIWDGKLGLVNYTYKWSSGCKYAHSPGGDRGPPDYGENVAWGFSTCEKAASKWYAEVSIYDGPDSLNNWYKYGHFTAMVWKATTHLGCGYVHCATGTMLTCGYYPRGNVMDSDEFRANVQKLK